MHEVWLHSQGMLHSETRSVPAPMNVGNHGKAWPLAKRGFDNAISALANRLFQMVSITWTNLIPCFEDLWEGTSRRALLGMLGFHHRLQFCFVQFERISYACFVVLTHKTLIWSVLHRLDAVKNLPEPLLSQEDCPILGSHSYARSCRWFGL